MPTNDTQTMLARFFGRLQAEQIHAKLQDETEEGTFVPTDRLKVEVTEHCVRVVDTTTGKMEYSNSIFTCAQAATPIRNLAVYVVARAMKKIFIARQRHTGQGHLGQRWEDFSLQDDLIPSKSGDVVRYINSLKAETERALFGAQITGSVSLEPGVALAKIDATVTEMQKTMHDVVEHMMYCYFSDEDQQRLADKFVDELLEQRLVAKQQVKTALAEVEQIRRNNREKAGKPLADKFQVLTGKPAEKTLTLAEAQKVHEDARRLFNALEWLSAELELVPDTLGTAGKLFYGLVRRF